MLQVPAPRLTLLLLPEQARKGSPGQVPGFLWSAEIWRSESSCVGVHGPVAGNALGLPSQVAQAPGPTQQQAAEGPTGQGATNGKSCSLCPIKVQRQCHPHHVLGYEQAQHRGQWRPASGHSEPAQSRLIGSTGRQWLSTYPPSDCDCRLEPAQQYKGVGWPGAHDAIK